MPHFDSVPVTLRWVAHLGCRGAQHPCSQQAGPTMVLGLKGPRADMKRDNTSASQPPFIVTVNLSLDGDIKVILVVLAIFSLVAMVALVAIALAVMALVRILKSQT